MFLLFILLFLCYFLIVPFTLEYDKILIMNLKTQINLFPDRTKKNIMIILVATRSAIFQGRP